MAGHSKWANIKHRKAKQDAKRGKLYTKLIREITISAKLGGADPDANPRLRAAWDSALVANMSKDVIDRAVKRGAGGLEGQDVEEVRYEGYGTNGVAILVDCMTNNRNRTVAEVRHAFSKCGGNLATEGAVAYLFQQRGQLMFAPGVNEERVMEIALETGALDVITNEDGSVEVITSPDHLTTVKNAMIHSKLMPESAEITLLANVQVELPDEESTEKLTRLIDMLEELDDVQMVYSNASF